MLNTVPHNNMRVWTRIIAALAVQVSAAAPPVWAFGVQIAPPIVETVVARGRTTNGTIDVENQSDQPTTLEVYLQDWEYVEGGSGDKLFSVPGASPWSAAAWISFYPQKLSLPAHGKGVIEYTIRVPADAPAGGRYAVMFFESALGPAQLNEQGVSVQYTGRIGSLFEVQVAGTIERAGEITNVTVGAIAEDRPLSLGYTFVNKGNVVLRPKTVFNIIDSSGRYFGRGEFKTLYTFPGRSGSTTTEWKGTLKPREYTVVVTADLGNHQVVVAEHPLSVK